MVDQLIPLGDPNWVPQTLADLTELARWIGKNVSPVKGEDPAIAKSVKAQTLPPAPENTVVDVGDAIKQASARTAWHGDPVQPPINLIGGNPVLANPSLPDANVTLPRFPDYGTVSSALGFDHRKAARRWSVFPLFGNTQGAMVSHNGTCWTELSAPIDGTNLYVLTCSSQSPSWTLTEECDTPDTASLSASNTFTAQNNFTNTAASSAVNLNATGAAAIAVTQNSTQPAQTWSNASGVQATLTASGQLSITNHSGVAGIAFTSGTSGDADRSAQRTELGLGGAAVLNVGTGAGQVSAGDRMLETFQTTWTDSAKVCGVDGSGGLALVAGGGGANANGTYFVMGTTDAPVNARQLVFEPTQFDLAEGIGTYEVFIHYGTFAGVTAEGNDARFHAEVSVTGDGLNLVDQNLNLVFGTNSGDVADGDDGRFHEAATTDGNGIQISGQNITLTFGSNSNTVAAGNDSRFGTPTGTQIATLSSGTISAGQTTMAVGTTGAMQTTGCTHAQIVANAGTVHAALTGTNAHSLALASSSTAGLAKSSPAGGVQADANGMFSLDFNTPSTITIADEDIILIYDTSASATCKIAASALKTYCQGGLSTGLTADEVLAITW